MFFYPRSKDRPAHLGAYPLEALPRNQGPRNQGPRNQGPRNQGIVENESALPPVNLQELQATNSILGRVADQYRGIFSDLTDGEVAAAQAPVGDDLIRRMIDIKGAAGFMDASHVGICNIPQNAWVQSANPLDHEFAIVILIETARLPEANNPAYEWVQTSVQSVMDLRAAEIAVCIAGHIRNMGFSARAHIAGNGSLDAERLAVLSGLAVRKGGKLINPFFGENFTLSVISTAYALPVDEPLHEDALKSLGFKYWWGMNGARSGREHNRRAKRATHLSRYPMETVKRIDRPTTFILDDEVPRVPKRAAFFQRALHGDLGAKSQGERSRFAFKTPFSYSLLDIIRSMVPHQDGPVAKADTQAFSDAAANTKAIKSLSYFLGSDLTGICEIPDYAWFSHKEDGKQIKPYHKYAVVMLIDQGYDTMEGASGDDWASGPQSMRGYLRGAEIAGVMAEFLRQQGTSARPQTNADSDVLQIPLILWAGLGELSRIGELVLNPFVGPRFKSVVMTTDLPLVADKPIDFGLQYFCNNCLKCARECPCDAIPFGDKIMFNGYEIWKPDVERCTRYRLTNPKGAACGRCMKTCPINKVVDADGAILARVGSWFGVHARWLKPVMVPFATWIDDYLGNGKRNPLKKWWYDHETIDGVAVDPPKGTSQRDIDPSRVVDPAKQKMAYYHADMMPAPDEQGPVVVDRKAAMAAVAKLETPKQAKKRQAAGGKFADHYIPVPPLGNSVAEDAIVGSPYQQKTKAYTVKP